MKVLVLAAGRSKRMAPLQDKNFLEFLGKPLLQYQLEMFLDRNFTEVIVVAGAHNIKKIKDLCGKLGKKFRVIEQKDLEMGMCGAILAAKKLLGKEPVLVFSSNDVVDKKAFDLILKEGKNKNFESYILGKKVAKYFPGGYLEVAKDGLIKSIIEKPAPGKEPSDMINLVVHLHKNPADLISYLEKVKSKNDDKYEVALDKMMKGGVKMKAVKYDGFWQPIKFPWHVIAVFRYFMEGAKAKISKKAKIAKTATISGKVIIEDGVTVYDNAVISGPVYIGKGSIIANNSLVRESNIGANCVIGFSTEVARSFLQNDVWTHSNYVGDSVIGNNVSFGAGTVTGNLRLDEKNIYVDHGGVKMDSGTPKFGLICGDNVRVGVNTCFMPGIKVGANSFVGAGITISQNIPGESFVRGKWELKISKNLEGVRDRNEFKKKLKK